MSTARISTLASLRGSIERIEAAPSGATALHRVALGHASADATLRGGLAMAAMHEVFAEGRESAAATGFIAGLARRIAPRRPLVWVRQDFSEIESGALSMSGLAELGLDPRLLVTVRATDVDHALRTSRGRAGLRSRLGAVVLEVWGPSARQFDLVASRKLTLAAQASGRRPALLLRVAAEPVSRRAAETRWIVCARRTRRRRHSAGAHGARRLFDAQLVPLPSCGPVGRWIMEWKCDECLFGKPAAYPQPVAAAPAYRPHQAGQSVFKRSGYRFA